MKDKEKFVCSDCGCSYWVKDRNNFNCSNCEDKACLDSGFWGDN